MSTSVKSHAGGQKGQETQIVTNFCHRKDMFGYIFITLERFSHFFVRKNFVPFQNDLF